MNARKLSLGLLPALLALLLVAKVGPALAGTPGTAKYDFRVDDVPGAHTLNQPALARDNTMYVGGKENGLVYAVSPDGTVQWVYDAGSGVTTNAAVYYSPDGQNAQYDGTIYVGLEDGRVLALGPMGDLKWEFDAGTPINASPALAADGTIYVGKEPTVLVAIKPDGEHRWSRTLAGAQGITDPVVAPDGTIYFGNKETRYFYAYNSAGVPMWGVTGMGFIRTPAAVGRDGTIYIGCGNRLYALWPNGDQKWYFDLGPDATVLRSAPVIGHQGTIYMSATILVAVNPDGSWAWDFWYDGERPRVNSSVAVDSSGLIYAPAYDGYIYCLAPGGSFVWRYQAMDPEWWLSAPVVGSDGHLYATDYFNVRALYTGATGPFDSSWPMYRCDAACSARLDKYWYMMLSMRDLLVFVSYSSLPKGTAHSLVVKLESAMESLDARLLLPAVHKLGAFVNHVEAQAGKKIPEELADAFIADALHIMMMADADVHELPQDTGTPGGKASRPTRPKEPTPEPSSRPNSPPKAVAPPRIDGGP